MRIKNIKNIKTKIKDSKAITLIALVITIVVLIILAAVAINLSLGNNGIFNRAKSAKEQYSNAQEYEGVEIDKAYNRIGSVGSFRDVSEDEIRNIARSELGLSHQSLTGPIFTILCPEGSGNTAAATRNMSNFTSNMTRASNFDNYFEYNTTTNKLVCKKEGQYVLNLSSRIHRVNDSGLYTSLVVNSTSMDGIVSYVDGGNYNNQSSKMATVYLKENDTVDISVRNTGTVNYYGVYFYVYAN